jgi:hypothetical protein
MSGRRRRCLRPVVLTATLLAALGVVLGAGAPSAPALTVERIQRYLVDFVIRDDGTVLVTETIAYDFGDEPHHGIYRDIPLEERYDDEQDRVYGFDLVEVSSTTPGTPVQTQTTEDGGTVRIRIGSPTETITGEHEYTIVYELDHALNGFEDHDELYWDAIGTAWGVPIDEVHVSVSAPAAVTKVDCFTGWEGGTDPCPESRIVNGTAEFDGAGLRAHDGFTVVVALPKGVVPEPTPVLQDRNRIRRAFRPSWGAGIGAGAATLAAGGAIWYLLGRRGRDERYTGSAVDAAFGNTSGTAERVGVFERAGGPVEFVPPNGIRPGEVGTLLDERANPIDVSASIVDLAVRGYLRIDETEEAGFLRKADYRLSKLREPGPELQRYESVLLQGLFETGDEVDLSDLKYKFAPRLREVQDALYDDVVAKGWFRRRPDEDRTHVALLGVLLAGLGVGLTFLLAKKTSYALAGLPLILGGVLLLVFHGRAPARAPAGRAMFTRVLGFREIFEAGEIDRSRFAEQQNIFSEYLPYAIVYGLVGKWAKAFEDLALTPDTSSWYGSSYVLTPVLLAQSLDGFAVQSAGTMSVTQSTSSSGGSGFSGGFSGGGGGGGGGGSW